MSDEEIIDDGPTCAKCGCLILVDYGLEWDQGTDMCYDCTVQALAAANEQNRNNVACYQQQVADLTGQLVAADEQIAKLQGDCDIQLDTIKRLQQERDALRTAFSVSDGKAYVAAKTIEEQVKRIIGLEQENEQLKAERGYSIDRDFLGSLVRHTWVEWAKKQNDPKPLWLVPWSELDEDNKEVDRLIGEAVANVCVSPHLLLAEQEIAKLQRENERLKAESAARHESYGKMVGRLNVAEARLAELEAKFAPGEDDDVITVEGEQP